MEIWLVRYLSLFLMQVSNKVGKNMEMGREDRQCWAKDQNDAVPERAGGCAASSCYKTSCVLFKNSFRRINVFFLWCWAENRSWNFNVKACGIAVLLWRYILVALMLQAVLCISSVFSKNKTERVSYTFFQNFTSPDLCRCEFIARQHKTFFFLIRSLCF